MPPLACPHLTNFFASHGAVMRYAAEKVESRRLDCRASGDGRWPRRCAGPGRRHRGRVVVAWPSTHVGHELTAAEC